MQESLVSSAAEATVASTRSSPRGGHLQGLRRQNLSLVLRHLWQSGPRSRTDIALETGLSKGAVSLLAEELYSRGLVRERGITQGKLGRPARILEVDGSAVGAVALQVNVESIVSFGVDLAGRVLVEETVLADMASMSVADGVRRVAGAARDALADMHRAGAPAAGLALSIPALVDVPQGRVILAPNLGWRDVSLADMLRKAVGVDLPITVDNDANLGALAEFREGGQAGNPHLLYLTGEVGVGGGVIVGGSLLRGADGFAGEVGHMPVDSTGEICGCGRTGCWETKVGLAALVRTTSRGRLSGLNGLIGPRERCAEVLEWAQTGDVTTLAALAEIGTWLGIGAASLINLFNPRVLVLGGYFSQLAEYVVPPAARELDRLVVAGPAARFTIVPSTLGFTAGVRGGAGVVLQQVLDDPTLIPAAPEVAARRRAI